MDKKKILFVDDEPNVLQGLRRMLRSMRDEWEINTALGGLEALDELSKTNYDVIVTDMRMPGMDGAQLLQEVITHYPQVVRIVLSGQSDQESVMRSIGPTHQYLSKPCDTATLKATVDRACTLHHLLENNALRQLVSKMQSLPSMPVLYTEIMKEIRSEEPSIEKIGRIINKDPGMTAKILQLVNSAFFGFYNNIQDTTRAVNILGLDKVRSLVLTIHIFSEFNQAQLSRFNLNELWQHNLYVGECAKLLAQNEGKEKQFLDECYMSGLLHDTGKVILMANLPDEYAKALTLAKEKELPLADAEKQIMGATHSEVGAYLLGLWGLPSAIIEAIVYHHRPSDCIEKTITPLTFLHAANTLVLKAKPHPGIISEVYDLQYFEALNLSDRLDPWFNLCREFIGKGDHNE